MATYTLIPSSLTGGVARDRSNAYADTNSDTYCYLGIKNSDPAYLGGFNFDIIPSSERIISMTVKIKGCLPQHSMVMSSADGVSLSEDLQCSGIFDPAVDTYVLTENGETIRQFADTLCLKIYSEGSSTASSYVYGELYGAEIIVETAQREKNKIIFDGNTLIDLTSDTVTEADVLSGIYFHLPNGERTLGTLVTSPTSKNKATTSTTARSVAFTGLTKEPSYFWIMPMIASNVRTGRVTGVVYNGTTTYIMYTDGSSAGKLVRSTSVGSWTYSNGTLTFGVSSSAYLGEATWYIWYL